MFNYSINHQYQLNQSIEIVNTNKNETIKTEATSISKFNGQDSEAVVRITQTFQSLSLLDAKPLDSQLNKMCIILLKKNINKLNQTENVQEFRETLEGLLNDFSIRITESTNTDFIKVLQHDLKHKSLVEIFIKYYAHTIPAKETLLSLFAPYLGDKEKIQKLAEKEAESLPQKIQSHMEFFAANRDELMTLLINRKKEKNSSLNCYVIDICDLPACVEGLKKLKQSLSSEHSERIQLLVRNDVHYTGVDIQLSKTGTQAAVMDAAGDLRCKDILSELKNLECQSMYALGLRDRIQFDKYNCAFFSFDSVDQSSKDPHFFDLLSKLPAEKEDHYSSLSWKNTPPRYVRNATSLSFVKNYHESNPTRDAIYKDNEIFASYMNKHVGKREINGAERDAHTVLEDKVTKQRAKIQLLLKQLSAKDLSDVMNHYSAQALLSQAIKQI